MQVDPAYFTWWQRSDLGYQQGELNFAGSAVRELIAEHGTPTFVYSKQRVTDNIQRLKSALDDTALVGRYKILFAMKANRFAPLLQFLARQGMVGIDACSPNEVAHALACGFEPDQISFTAGSLSQHDVSRLDEFEGLFMNCDSLYSIETWGRLKPGSEIGIRVNPGLGVSRACNDRLQYAGTVTTKFGIYKEQFVEALALANRYQLTVSKIHFHTGCGYLTSELNQLDQVISECLWFVENCPDVSRVNVGGGLGVPHSAGENPLDLGKWAAVLAKHFASRDILIEMEPGEYIVKDSGLLLLSKTYLEKKRNTLFLGVDAGFNIAPEPAYYNLPFQPVSLIDPQGKAAPKLKKVTVVGNINEALDVWYEDALLPNMQQETHLTLINAGGYSSSMASNHCMRGEFTEILLD
ncbi:MAG: diaminopimelate decarboxylase [Gammaproteobacteria bacterium]|nr:diaminopimelate decarboxylase [Gammaproteobacteria bacterium]